MPLIETDRPQRPFFFFSQDHVIDGVTKCLLLIGMKLVDKLEVSDESLLTLNGTLPQ